MSRRGMVRVAAAALVISGVAVSTAACSASDQSPILGLFEPTTATSSTSTPTPAPETRTPNLDGGFSTYWMLLPGGKEKVLCFEHTYDGDPHWSHVNGVFGSCDWDHKQPVAIGGGEK
ncbi:hypothetical protein [Mycobacteroides abscessus]|uniref:hypothetical protein n=1 Tax=Mycobacteroides abscessus TaxID=36809 RepID=UPI0005E4ED6A|nr:hypothetical protein [Mycobacteroides abscessus]CPW92489.1 Uncharacterised protein [Mycobacteroides abscessus]SKF41787.1 Uncharacterised protein [Mycobacteroides abscessus subsp. bolletii]SKH18289.1 Uncharacterised protein [Mycobacteroides abscessus subsp. bolletii]